MAQSTQNSCNLEVGMAREVTGQDDGVWWGCTIVANVDGPGVRGGPAVVGGPVVVGGPAVIGGLAVVSGPAVTE